MILINIFPLTILCILTFATSALSDMREEADRTAATNITGQISTGIKNARPDIVLSPGIEAIEVTSLGDRAHIKSTRTYTVSGDRATIAASYYAIVPWQWGEREIKALCQPVFSVEEGEIIEGGVGDEGVWEELPRSNYPCLELGAKVMAFRKIFSVNAPLGVVTTIFSIRQPIRMGRTAVIAEEGEGSRFVGQVCHRGEDAVAVCGDVEAAESGETESGKLERRWRLSPGELLDIYTFSLQSGGF